MNIQFLDSLILDDDNEYIVVSKVHYNQQNHYCLVDKNNADNLKFCYEDGDELVEANNKELNTILLPLFLEEGKKALESLSVEG